MTKTVCVKNADWVVAWDASSRRHAYLEHGDVVFAGDTLTFVGRELFGPRRRDDRRPRPHGDARPDQHPLPPRPRGQLSRHPRGARRARDVHVGPLRARAGVYVAGRRGASCACAEVAYCELLRSGVTTLVDISRDLRGLDRADRRRSGLRGFLAPGYASRAGCCADDHCSTTTGTRRAAARRSRRRCGSATTWPSIPAGACPA